MTQVVHTQSEWRDYKRKIENWFWEISPSSIRLPTATWLFSDLFGLLDSNVRKMISELIEEEILLIDSGGWISFNLYLEEPQHDETSTS